MNSPSNNGTDIGHRSSIIFSVQIIQWLIEKPETGNRIFKQYSFIH